MENILIKSVFEKVGVFRCKSFSKKGSDSNIHEQRSGGEILEKKYLIQRISQ
jgi:hypothetical protein